VTVLDGFDLDLVSSFVISIEAVRLDGVLDTVGSAATVDEWVSAPVAVKESAIKDELDLVGVVDADQMGAVCVTDSVRVNVKEVSRFLRAPR
jgi:hypothetical protein